MEDYTRVLGCNIHRVGPVTSLPNRILTDQGSQFGDVFINIAAASDVKVDRTGVEAHSSLGLGERFHQPLRNTYRKRVVEHPNSDKTLALLLAVKSMNDTLGPEGLVPSALMFGEYPQAYAKSEIKGERFTLSGRAELATTARKEMELQMAKLRVKRALSYAAPPAADRSYQPGDRVLVWRENVVNNRIGEWMGPFTVMATDERKKLAYVQDVKIGAARPFNVVQVKPYYAADTLAHSFMLDLGQSLRQFGSPQEQEFFLTEIIENSDPRANSKEMENAKAKEIRNLLSRGTFKVILKEDIPPDGNVLPGRFVLAIKSTEDNKVIYKARYVIGGHRDKFKDMMVHTSTTLQPQSIRLLLAMASMFGFDIWTADVRQAYLQAAETLSREIFLKRPALEFGLRLDQCFQLLKPLYGLCESGDLWHETLDKHHRADLGMKPFRIDPALYYLISNGILRGLSGSYVDDIIRTGDDKFRKISRKTGEKFEMAEEEEIPCTFTGFSLSRDSKGSIMLDQHSYLRKLEILHLDASLGMFL